MTVAALSLALASCPAAVCEQLETRCADTVVQLCDARGRWQDVMDCTTVEPGDWHCAADEEGAICRAR